MLQNTSSQVLRLICRGATLWSCVQQTVLVALKSLPWSRGGFHRRLLRRWVLMLRSQGWLMSLQWLHCRPFCGRRLQQICSPEHELQENNYLGAKGQGECACT